MEEKGKMKVEKFNGKNFQLWKMQMEDYLYQKDLWHPLEGKFNKLTAMRNEDQDILDRKALGSIHLCLAQSVTFNITKEKTTKEQMQTLTRLYEKSST